jgi:hypothetical protein
MISEKERIGYAVIDGGTNFGVAPEQDAGKQKDSK